MQMRDVIFTGNHRDEYEVLNVNTHAKNSGSLAYKANEIRGAQTRYSTVFRFPVGG